MRCCIVCISIVNTIHILLSGGDILINLNYRDSRPIYSQIKDGLRRLIVTGAMLPGDKLPSVRELASELAINPNTIQRAYRELEADGYINSVAGKGSFAADVSEMPAERRDQNLKIFDEASTELLYHGYGSEKLKNRIDTLSSKMEV